MLRFLITARHRERSGTTPVEEPVAKVTLPEGIRSAIILLHRAADDDAPKFQSIVIDADTKKFPKGSRCLANTSNTSIRGVLGKMPLQRGIEFEHPENGWLPIAQTRWFHTPKIRHIMVVYRTPNSNRIRLHGILDQSLAKIQNEEAIK